MSHYEVTTTADEARRKKTKEKCQYGAYFPNEHTLGRSPGISLSVARRPLRCSVIMAHIPYISLKKKSPLTSLVLYLLDSGWCFYKRLQSNYSGKKHSYFIWQPWCIVCAQITEPAANFGLQTGGSRGDQHASIIFHTSNWCFTIILYSAWT